MKYLHHSLEREINAENLKNLWFAFGEEYGGVCFILSVLKSKLKSQAAANGGTLSIHEINFKQLNAEPELLNEVTRSYSLFGQKKENKLIVIDSVSNDISAELSQRLSKHISTPSRNTFIAVIGSGLKKNMKTRRFFESPSVARHIALFHSYSPSEQEKQSFWLYLLSKNRLQLTILLGCPDSLLSTHIILCTSRMEIVNAIEKMCISAQHECDVFDLSDKKHINVCRISVSEEEIKVFFPFENDIALLDIAHYLLFRERHFYYRVNLETTLDIAALRWLQSYYVKLSTLHQICLQFSSDAEVMNAMLELHIFLSNKQKSDLIKALRSTPSSKISELIILLLFQEKAIRTITENEFIDAIQENDKVTLQKLLQQ
ncbi:DNA polymerase III subunit delta [Candidatus Fokinia solitaria]|uniref:DNA polymerase III subunit delta n=1 Tax=Candidatus Fokinia solitaria TaxID=1802984 RepID=A0A2U8BSS7_9RICK|nr:hypothetical protein [Candidatus Fokinia solitaria]AWD33392.1 DNA polymerase III subunit delta [Candidatus Fokinia solitaria]